MKRIALFGGSFQPPGLHHRQIAEALSNAFDEVVVVPCGPRPDKPTTNTLDPAFRGTMVDIAFRDIPKVRVDLFDLEQDTFTRAIDLEPRYRDDGEVWHIVGTDLVRGGAAGTSEIQRTWHRGPEFWADARFGILTRPGYEVPREDLPLHHRILTIDVPGASQELRDKLRRGDDISAALPRGVWEYINRWQLYTTPPTNFRCPFRLGQPAIELQFDPENKDAVRLAEVFQPLVSPDPELIVVIGGDGTMLRTIRSQWRRRLPFYGVNAGHVGSLLNRPEAPFAEGVELVDFHLPLLSVEAMGAPRSNQLTYAFNDAWADRATGQAAWIEIKIDGAVTTEKLVADGILLATAAGSHSYARAMGAKELPLGDPNLVLAGSNVLFPRDWQQREVGRNSVVEFHSLNPVKRPLIGYVDGTTLGPVDGLKLRRSRTASVELLLHPDHPAVGPKL